MPADTVQRKKRSSVAVSTPAPEGDHRKRRRNRTTQSCLQCHASKRMCDRRRPACQRCTTLGLTGLCVYEVDDPTQRDQRQDEKTLLRSRVAELEGVIREMKNKPHPRWVQKASTSEAGFNKWHSRTRGLSMDSQMSDVPSASSSSSLPDLTRANSPYPAQPEQPEPLLAAPCPLPQSPPSIQLSIVSPTPVSTPAPESASRLLRPPPFLHLTIPSPMSSASSSMPSPVSDMSPLGSHVGTPAAESPCYDMSSMLSSTSLEPSGFEDGVFGHILEQIMHNDQVKAEGHYARHLDAHQMHDPTGLHCGCLHNALAYNTVLELSVRLRKAAETLGRLAEHGHGTDCPLFSKVAELDSMTSTAIGNASSPCDQPTTPSVLRHRDYSVAASHMYGGHSPSHPGLLSAPQSLHPMQQWDRLPSRHQRSSSDEDSLMSWDVSRRPDWPHSANM